jgi:putative (di)nucleoside polyphosphate hydrolase
MKPRRSKVSSPGRMKGPGRYFRAGVGAVIVDARDRVMLFERRDIPGAWQFPQGGLEKGETPIQAIIREIKEETGIGRSRLKLLAQFPTWMAYELPTAAQSPKTGMGQAQRWFFFRMKDHTGITGLKYHEEFQSSDRVSFSTAISRSAPFKRLLYRQLHRYFQQHIASRVRPRRRSDI